MSRTDFETGPEGGICVAVASDAANARSLGDARADPRVPRWAVA